MVMGKASRSLKAGNKVGPRYLLLWLPPQGHPRLGVSLSLRPCFSLGDPLLVGSGNYSPDIPLELEVATVHHDWPWVPGGRLPWVPGGHLPRVAGHPAPPPTVSDPLSEPCACCHVQVNHLFPVGL